jgi:hypothetical protein
MMNLSEKTGVATFTNSGGKEYEVIRVDFSKKVAILKPNKVVFEDAPYLVAFGFQWDKDQWDGGIYDMTLEEAEGVFNDRL